MGHFVDDDVFEEVLGVLDQFGVEADVAGAVVAAAPFGFHALLEIVVKGGLATTRSEARSFYPSLNLGSERVLPVRMFAVGKSCRIMFMPARPAVVTSISWPSKVICLLAAESTISKKEANPQVRKLERCGAIDAPFQ